MKLYILRPVEGLGNDNPWEPWYDKAFGFVVRADSADQARQFANEDAGDENRGMFLSKKTANTTAPWTDEKYSTCEELKADGEAGVVMKDFAAA